MVVVLNAKILPLDAFPQHQGIEKKRDEKILINYHLSSSQN